MKNVNQISTSRLRIFSRVTSLFALLVFAVAGFGQSMQVKGNVTDDAGQPMAGVTVLVQGTATGVLTDGNGNYTITADKGSTLVFSMVSFETFTAVVGDNPTINAAMRFSTLDEVVVTGYTSQRQGDITGAVSVIDTEEMNQIAATSFSQKLEGRASGVQVSTSGAPGAGSQIRIRGISSFQNNDPLYVIDGVPTTDNFNNAFNPNDIESIQVLKDASAASIYGARANNGVVIITTKKGKAGKTKVTYDAYFGVQNPVGKYDLIVDPRDYSEIVWRAYDPDPAQDVPAEFPYAFGRGQIPDYLYYGGTSGYPGSTPVDESLYSYPNFLIHQSNPNGTDWWDEVFDPAPMTEHTLGISGGTENSNFYVSAGYIDQQGTMIHSDFERFSLRANSSFKAGAFTFGENISMTRVTSTGQRGGNQSEGNTMTQILKAQSIIPVYDISGTNFAGAKANGLSNGGNPVAYQYRNRNNGFEGYRVLGNFFGEVELLKGLKVRSSFGVDFSSNFSSGFNFPTWEESEPTTVNSFGENWSRGLTYTWTNQATYNTSFGDSDLDVLVGYEAIKGSGRNIGGSFAQYFTDNINAWYLSSALANPDTRSVGSGGGFSTLTSTFAKVDYTYANKYLVSATIRRDGSSNFGDEKYGTFPAFSLGWRLSEESFMQDIGALSDLKLRFGWGVTGNQTIPGGNAFDRFGGGTGSSFYAINGGNSLATGYALTNIGNAATVWEENVSANIGIDASFFDGRLGLVVDLYQRTVDGLLFNPQNPGIAGGASPAFINVASMENRGIDVGINYLAQIGELGLDLSLNLSHYRNEVIDIDGNSESYFPSGGGRLGVNRTINQIGSPIGSFYGFTYDGIFRSEEEVNAHAAQDGKALGRIRFADINSDGVVNADDLGIIGNYHPDLTGGFNIGANYKGFDANIFFFFTLGNEIMNYNKLFEVFRFFSTNVRKEVLTDSFDPVNNPNGTLPRIDENDTFSEQPSGFYVEDGSYLRARNVQIGYTIPSAATSAIGIEKLRIYVQAQNLFTITGYSGIDPALSNFEQGDSFGGVDEGNYPGSKIFMVGLNLGF